MRGKFKTAQANDPILDQLAQNVIKIQINPVNCQEMNLDGN